MRCRKNLGFTLIELLVALSIFAVVATLSVQGMHNLVEAKTVQRRHTDSLNEKQLLHAILSQDLSQIVKRPIRLDGSALLVAFRGEIADGRPRGSAQAESSLLEFTRAGLPNPEGMAPRSTLQRVEYFLRGKQLFRRVWGHVDRDASTAHTDKLLLDGIDAFAMEYIDITNRPHPNWFLSPPNSPHHSAHSKVEHADLPVAIRMRLQVKDYGSVEWWFRLPGGRRAQAI